MAGLEFLFPDYIEDSDNGLLQLSLPRDCICLIDGCAREVFFRSRIITNNNSVSPVGLPEDCLRVNFQ
jgi:hypothetical protein